jgi:hypothetical protein
LWSPLPSEHKMLWLNIILREKNENIPKKRAEIEKVLAI